jgi:outer membrane protein TolC
MFHSIFLALVMLAGDVETLTLKQAVDMALGTSPELKIAQAQEEAAKQSIAEARSSFIPAFYIGSGAAYTRGALQQIEGQPPAIAQDYAVSQIFNVPQRYAIRELQANSMAVGVTALSRRDELIWRVASTYLDLDRASRTLDVARKETESLEKLQALTLERVKEGQEIPSEGTRARLGVAKNRQRLVELEGRTSLLESTLKSMLSMPEDRRIRTVPDSMPAAGAADSPAEEAHAIARALPSTTAWS